MANDDKEQDGCHGKALQYFCIRLKNFPIESLKQPVSPWILDYVRYVWRSSYQAYIVYRSRLLYTGQLEGMFQHASGRSSLPNYAVLQLMFVKPKHSFNFIPPMTVVSNVTW